MTKENDSKNQDNDSTNANQDSNKNNDDSNKSGKDENVPLKTFLEKKQELKEAKDKLAAFEARDKKAADDKLLEEKKYQDLIASREKDLADAKAQLETERKNNKIEKIKNRFSNELSKANAIDSEDALKFINYDDLLDSENFDNELKSRVENLVKTKSYLFKTAGTGRSNSENKTPSGNNDNKGSANNTKIDPTIASLAQKFSKQ